MSVWKHKGEVVAEDDGEMEWWLVEAWDRWAWGNHDVEGLGRWLDDAMWDHVDSTMRVSDVLRGLDRTPAERIARNLMGDFVSGFALEALREGVPGTDVEAIGEADRWPA